MQVQCDDACFLVDPIPIDDFAPLARLCENSGQIKVLHSCSEDLEVFSGLLDVMPEPLFDTQVAAALLGSKLSQGYQDLVADVLDIEIPKGETRSDWLQRPLTASQCEYAALDVSHLLEVYHRQFAQLDELNRVEWVLEDCARLVDQQISRQDPDLYYVRIKQAWKLDRSQLLVLKTICAWRERRARAENRPRNWVVSDNALYAIARSGIQGRRELHEIAGMTPSQVRRVGEELLELVAEAARVPPALCPEPLPAPPRGKRSSRLAELRLLVEERAAELGMVPEMLVKKKQLEDLMVSGLSGEGFELPAELQGWREPVIGTELLARMEESVTR